MVRKTLPLSLWLVVEENVGKSGGKPDSPDLSNRALSKKAVTIKRKTQHQTAKIIGRRKTGRGEDSTMVIVKAMGMAS